MKILAPYINGVSIGEDRYIFLDMGKREYNYISDLYRKFEKTKMQRAKLYIFVAYMTDISYLKPVLDLLKRNISLTKGTPHGFKVHIYSSRKMFKPMKDEIRHKLKDILEEYDGLYLFDGSDSELFGCEKTTCIYVRQNILTDRYEIIIEPKHSIITIKW